MKKILLGIVGVSMLGLCSCDPSSGDNRTSVGYANLNLVSSLSGAGETYLTDAVYRFNFNFSQNNVIVESTGLKVDNVNYNFTSSAGSFTQYYVETSQGYGMSTIVKGLVGNVNNDTALPLSGFNAEITGLFYWNTSTIPGISTPVLNSADPSMLIMQYNIGTQYNVKTVQPDCFYCGTTTTAMTMNGVTNSFDTKDMAYRVKFNSGFKTADVIIYNAKFSAQMPKPLTAVVLKDVPVKLSRGTYTIETEEEIIPMVPETGALTKYENYPFKSFKLQFMNDALTMANIRYEVNVTMKMGEETVSVPATGEVMGASYVVQQSSSPSPTPQPAS